MIISKLDDGSAELVARELGFKNVVIIPTDTVYGFSGIVPDTEACIRKIKGRGDDKPFIRLISCPGDISFYSDDVLPAGLLDFWPGALTVIVQLKPEHACFAGETAAFRCPGDEWLRTVISICGRPVYSTSVNRSGSPLLRSIKDMEKEFSSEVSLIVDAGNDLDDSTQPSTIVALENGLCRIVRQGAVYLPASLIA